MSWQFDLCADHLALDFANTMTERHMPEPVERLPAYSDLVDFARQRGLIDQPRADALVARGTRHPVRAGRVRAQAIELREAIYRMFAAVARGQGAGQDDLDRLNAEMGRLRLRPNLSLGWAQESGSLDDFLGAVVLAAVELASIEEERSRVRICEAPDCDWLFYDGSRNRSRRWCDMRQCGNRMKARRHYQRSRGERPR